MNDLVQEFVDQHLFKAYCVIFSILAPIHIFLYYLTVTAGFQRVATPVFGNTDPALAQVPTDIGLVLVHANDVLMYQLIAYCSVVFFLMIAVAFVYFFRDLPAIKTRGRSFTYFTLFAIAGTALGASLLLLFLMGKLVSGQDQIQFVNPHPPNPDFNIQLTRKFQAVSYVIELLYIFASYALAAVFVCRLNLIYTLFNKIHEVVGSPVKFGRPIGYYLLAWLLITYVPLFTLSVWYSQDAALVTPQLGFSLASVLAGTLVTYMPMLVLGLFYAYRTRTVSFKYNDYWSTIRLIGLSLALSFTQVIWQSVLIYQNQQTALAYIDLPLFMSQSTVFNMSLFIFDSFISPVILSLWVTHRNKSKNIHPSSSAMNLMRAPDTI